MIKKNKQLSYLSHIKVICAQLQTRAKCCTLEGFIITMYDNRLACSLQRLRRTHMRCFRLTNAKHVDMASSYINGSQPG